MIFKESFTTPKNVPQPERGVYTDQWLHIPVPFLWDNIGVKSGFLQQEVCVMMDLTAKSIRAVMLFKGVLACTLRVLFSEELSVKGQCAG